MFIGKKFLRKKLFYNKAIRLLVYSIIVFYNITLVSMLNGCSSTQKILLDKCDIPVIIIDKNINDVKYSDYFIDNIYSALSSTCSSVAKKHDHDRKSDELVIVPTSFDLKKSNDWQKSINTTASVNIFLDNIEESYHVSGYGKSCSSCNAQSAFLAMATLAISLGIQNAIDESISFNSSLTMAANDLISKLNRSSKIKKTVEEIIIVKSSASDIQIATNFSDVLSFLPNKIFDATEESELTVIIKNSGAGPAYSSTLEIVSDNKNIIFVKFLTIGDIPPGESREVKVPLKAGLDLETGVATFTIQAKEKRGYDSKKVVMKIPTARLEPPKLEIASVELNDGDTGLAKGNGNGIPESGETVELTAYVRNSGVGKSLRSKLTGSDLTSGVDWVSREADLGDIPPGETVRAKLVYNIPRTFSSTEIASLLRVTDIRGVGTTEKRDVHAFGRLAPNIRLASSRLSAKGKPVTTLVNGETYQLDLSIENRGKIAAKDVALELSAPDGVQLSSRRIVIGDIKQQAGAPEQSVTVTLPRTFSGATLPLSLRLAQADFSSVDAPLPLTVDSRTPRVSYSASLRSRNGGNSLEQGESATLDIQVLNQGNLPAEGVRIKLASRDRNLMIMGKSEELIGRIPAQGSSETVKFQLASKRALKPGPASLEVTVTQEDFTGLQETYAMTIREEGAEVVEVAAESGSRTAAPRTVSQQGGPVITLKSQVAETVDASIPIAFDIADSGAIIDASSVTIQVNGEKLALDPGVVSATPEKRKQVLATIPLKGGENRIVISARNANYASTQKEFRITRSGDDDVDTPPVTGIRNPDAVAVVVGISKYKNMPAVEYARQDADAVRSYLIRTLGYSDDRVIRMSDTGADKTSLETTLFDDLGSLVKEGRSDVFIYFSGHGLPDVDSKDAVKDAYLAPYDFKPSSTKRSGIAVSDLYRRLDELKARSVTVVTDACFSGFTADGQALIKSASPALVKVKKNRLAGDQAAVFSSSTGNQISSWYPAKQHGIFTYYFLHGLRGSADADRDGAVTVGELAGYLAQYVPEQAKALHNRDQTPEVSGDRSRVLVRLK